MFRGRSKSPEQTVLILDVENGSVGAAFARLSPDAAPRLFGEMRKKTPILATRDAHTLAREIQKASEEALIHASEVAARMRGREQLAPLGFIERQAIFLRSPWVSIDFDEEKNPLTHGADDLIRSLQSLHSGYIGEAPITFHSFGASVSPILHRLFDTPAQSLVCYMGGEVTEVYVTTGTVITAHATLPFGSHTLIRTLQTHSGFSKEEVESLLKLPHGRQSEALHAAAAHVLSEFANIATALMHNESLTEVFVVGEAPFASWFAETLTHQDLGDVFTEGGSVRTVEPRHVMPYLSAHARRPDIPLMLASLFADQRFNSYT